MLTQDRETQITTSQTDDISKLINEFVMPPPTPPPGSVTPSGGVRSYQATMGGTPMAGGTTGLADPPVPSVDIAERQLNEARRVVEERETALKKAMKKNRKLLGLA